VNVKNREEDEREGRFYMLGGRMGKRVQRKKSSDWKSSKRPSQFSMLLGFLNFFKEEVTPSFLKRKK
jgi:hypothetical protein